MVRQWFEGLEKGICTELRRTLFCVGDFFGCGEETEDGVHGECDHGTQVIVVAAKSRDNY